MNKKETELTRNLILRSETPLSYLTYTLLQVRWKTTQPEVNGKSSQCSSAGTRAHALRVNGTIVEIHSEPSFWRERSQLIRESSVVSGDTNYKVQPFSNPSTSPQWPPQSPTKAFVDAQADISIRAILVRVENTFPLSHISLKTENYSVLPLISCWLTFKLKSIFACTLVTHKVT